MRKNIKKIAAVREKNSAIVCDQNVIEEVKSAVENQTVFDRDRFTSNYDY